MKNTLELSKQVPEPIKYRFKEALFNALAIYAKIAQAFKVILTGNVGGLLIHKRISTRGAVCPF